MKKFLTFILVCLLLTSFSKHKGLQVYKTTDKNGYCFFNDGLWYLYYMNQSTGQYYYYGATSNFNAYNNSSTVDWTPTAENVSNFSETPTEVTEVITESMSEANGESVGGTDVPSGFRVCGWNGRGLRSAARHRRAQHPHGSGADLRFR